MTTVVGLVGTGVIGTGWAVRALARSLDVVATDTADGAEQRLVDGIERAWPSAQKLGVFPDADSSRVTWLASASEVAEAAGFIQESVPENAGVKESVHVELDRHAPPEVIIASSSSGLLPSKMQAPLQHPERFLVGHPFNPVYLLPLVEVVPGHQTDRTAIDRATEFYLDLGMHPLVVKKEIEGYLADRLQEAMWREILHLVNDGVATTEELDQAIIYGPGLRWAGMGTNLIFHLAGGSGGMRHMLEQFGPALELPWAHVQAPELTEELIGRMAEGAEAQTEGRSVEDLERLRDDYLIAVMRALRAVDTGAGRVMARHDSRVLDHDARTWRDDEEVPVPLRLFSWRVEPEWVDYNGHMTESAYLLAAGRATDALFRYAGIDERYRSDGHSFYTVETHIGFLREASLDQRLDFSTYLLGVDEKRAHLIHLITESGRDDRLCSIEQVLVHVDTTAGRSAAILPGPREALDAVASAHRGANIGLEMTMGIG